MQSKQLSHLSNRHPRTENARGGQLPRARFARSISTRDRERAISVPPRPKPITPDQFRALLTIVGAEPVASDLKAILTIIYHTGIRPGELIGLRWVDVNVAKRFMVVNSKKDSDRRRVPFGDKVFQVLRERRAKEPRSEFVFGSSPDRVLCRSCEQLRALSDRNGIEPIGLSSIRYAFMSRWVAAGGDAAELACIIGTKSMARPFGSHVSFEFRYAAAARFQAQLEENCE